MKSTRTRWATCCGMLAALLLSAAVTYAGDVPAVLDMVPPDAAMVLVVPDMAALNKKIADLNTRLGNVTPEMADVLGTLKKDAGLANGMNDAGSYAMVFMRLPGQPAPGGAAAAAPPAAPAAPGAPANKAAPAPPTTPAPTPGMDDEPPIVMLIAVSDYNAFVANLGGKGSAAVTEMTPPNGGKKIYARKLGNYAVISDQKDLVADYKPAGGKAYYQKEAGTLGQSALTDADGLFIFNVNVVGNYLRQELKKSMDEAQKSGMTTPNMAVSMGFIDAFLRDTQMLVTAGTLSDQGLKISTAVQFKHDSKLASYFGAGKPSAGLLDQLPNGTFVGAMALNLTGLNVQDMIKDLINVMPKDQQDTYQKLMGTSLPMMKHLQSEAFALYPVKPPAAGTAAPPPAAPGAMPPIPRLLNAAGVFTTDDAGAYLKAFADNLKTMNGTKLPVNVPNFDANGKPTPKQEFLTYETSFTPNVKTIDGVTANGYSMKIDMPPSLSMMNPMMPLIDALGFTNYTGYIGTVGNHVISTTSQDEDLFKQTVEAVKSGKGLGGNAKITKAQATLASVKHPIAEGYVSVAGIMETVNAFRGNMGAPPMPIPADLVPIAFAGQTENDGVALHLHVPISVIAMGKDWFGMMMGNFGGPPQGQPVPPQQQGGGGAPAAPF